MKIAGFKFGRYLAWIRAVARSAGVSGFEVEQDSGRRVVEAVEKMIMVVLGGRGLVGRKVWRNRMKKGCLLCPIRTGYVCEVVDGNRVFGCGCFTPFKAVVRAPYAKGCWAKQYAPESGLGWSNS